MFGTLVIKRCRLNEEVKREYKKNYCGLCKALQHNHGNISRLTLNYDMTFLEILLNEIYPENIEEKNGGCIRENGKKITYYESKNINYVADMNIIVSYYNMIDDWNDDKNIIALSYAKMLKKDFEKVCKKYSNKISNIEKSLRKLNLIEKNNVINPDEAGSICGELFAELFAPYVDQYNDRLREFGQKIGKYTYILDACIDFDDDIKKGRYNPMLDFDKDLYEDVLNLLMQDVINSYEKLEIKNELIENVLNFGIWTKYDNYKKHKN